MLIIRTGAEYRRALFRAGELVALDPSPNSTEGRRLRRIAEAIETYERARFRFRKPTAGELAAFRAEQQRPR